MAPRRDRRRTVGQGSGVVRCARAGRNVPCSAFAAPAVSSVPTATRGVSRDTGGLPQKMLAIHEHLRNAGIHHAFGGALALAWCTQQARGTIDLDVNVFVGPERTDEALAALPSGVVATAEDRALLAR